jgi:hypothetical protein
MAFLPECRKPDRNNSELALGGSGSPARRSASKINLSQTNNFEPANSLLNQTEWNRELKNSRSGRAKQEQKALPPKKEKNSLSDTDNKGNKTVSLILQRESEKETARQPPNSQLALNSSPRSPTSNSRSASTRK